MQITVATRYSGPPDSGHGGYACGLIAGAVGEQVRVRLQKPVPLDTPLDIKPAFEGDERRWQVLDGMETIAAAVPTTVPMSAPEPPSYVDALAASKHYAGFNGHPYPACFVCGPERQRGDGLRIFASPIAGRDIVAAPWLPRAALGQEHGKVHPEFVWAALDCPGYFAAVPEGRPAVLGELAVHVNRLVHIDEPCVVVGWKIGVEGRKYRVGTALYDEDGELCAVGLATWIELTRS